MLPSPFGSTAASVASLRQPPVVSRASAEESPFTYLSNQALVYQAISSAPRSVAGKPWFGIQSKSYGVPPRMMISPVSTPAFEYLKDWPLLPSGSGSLVFGSGGMK